MTTQTESSQPANSQRASREPNPKQPAPANSEPQEQWQASLSVMHPEASDPDWRQYHAAWGG